MRKILWLILISCALFKIINITKEDFSALKNAKNYPPIAKPANLQQQSIVEIKGLVLRGRSDKKDANYVIKSSDVSQVSGNQFTLKEIDIAYQGAHFEPIKMIANHGVFDQAAKSICLSDKVSVSGDKYLINSDTLEMDLDSSTIKAKAIELRYIDSKINSDSCIIYNDSKGFKCHGNVKADIHFNGF